MEGAQSAVDDMQQQAQETAQGAINQAGDAVDSAQQAAGEAAQEAMSQAQQQAAQAQQQVNDAAQQGLAQANEAATQAQQARSEEHTSELQSLMRISYAVFCLKKNTKPLNLEKMY